MKARSLKFWQSPAQPTFSICGSSLAFHERTSIHMKLYILNILKGYIDGIFVFKSYIPSRYFLGCAKDALKSVQ